MNKEIIEDIEEVIVEVIKAPFKIADDLFKWIIGDEDNG